MHYIFEPGNEIRMLSFLEAEKYFSKFNAYLEV